MFPPAYPPAATSSDLIAATPPRPPTSPATYPCHHRRFNTKSHRNGSDVGVAQTRFRPSASQPSRPTPQARGGRLRTHVLPASSDPVASNPSVFLLFVLHQHSDLPLFKVSAPCRTRTNPFSGEAIGVVGSHQGRR
ncbi:hypothetical protein MLD38_031108 [Melastoma candidum]|uniref:Uncharacterized protein n=1 Tax=Melastoma candidum TaxID=119954 RepID=A0ACB9MQT5_9MYRT|nr:hypothetical protein MLD38_031108 [Melastoma candidum]